MRKAEIPKAVNPSGFWIPPLTPYVIQLWLLLSDNCNFLSGCGKLYWNPRTPCLWHVSNKEQYRKNGRKSLQKTPFRTQMIVMFSLTWVQVTHAIVCLLSILIAGLWLPKFLFSVRLPATVHLVIRVLHPPLLPSQARRDVLHSFLLALLI